MKPRFPAIVLIVCCIWLLTSCATTGTTAGTSSRYYNLSTELTETHIRQYLDTDPGTNSSYLYGKYLGIYVNTEVTRYRLALIQMENERYYLIYLDGNPGNNLWREGDIKAELDLTNVPGVFVGKWYMANKQSTAGVRLDFKHEDTFEAVIDDGTPFSGIYGDYYRRIYPRE